MVKALCGLIAIFLLFIVLNQCISGLVGAGIDHVVDLADDHVGINRKPNPSITHNINGSLVFEYITTRSDRLSTEIGSQFDTCPSHSAVVIRNDHGKTFGSAPLQVEREEVIGHKPFKVRCSLPFSLENIPEADSYEFHTVTAPDQNLDSTTLKAVVPLKRMRELEWSLALIR